MGLPDAVCLDFDFAVRALKRWADRREEATHQEPDHSPEQKRRMKTVPTYPTLTAVLGLRDEETTAMPAETAGEAMRLGDAFGGGDIDWEAFGLT